MPTSTERGSGFSVSKWEMNYLKCRYKAHRNKIAAAKPAIDCKPPTERPHVSFKKKKALMEERRQTTIVRENLRILNKTADIMSARMRRMISHQANTSANSNKSASTKRSNYRSLTNVIQRNTHVLLQWFLHKYGKYIPWWAEINYTQ